MKSAITSTETTGKPRQLHVLAAEGGIRLAVENDRDPFDTLDDLMAVIDALCPNWPTRDVNCGDWKVRL